MGLQYRKGKVTLQYLEEKPEVYKAIQLTFPKVTYEQLLEMIQIVGVSKAQTRAVVEALLTSLVHYMEIGHAVSLGQFGSFKPVFNSKTAKLLDDVDDTIGGKGFIKKINFYPGGKFKQMLKDLSVGGAGEALDVTA
ncbi:MAG: HU family DNA-binding protein [Bacteroidaceae bacterium]|nr:HU family DNA-binding protein [Bacteroidaceae bacterium]